MWRRLWAICLVCAVRLFSMAIVVLVFALSGHVCRETLLHWDSAPFDCQLACSWIQLFLCLSLCKTLVKLVYVSLTTRGSVGTAHSCSGRLLWALNPGFRSCIAWLVGPTGVLALPVDGAARHCSVHRWPDSARCTWPSSVGDSVQC